MKVTIEFKTISKTINGHMSCPKCGEELHLSSNGMTLWGCMKHTYKMCKFSWKHKKECFNEPVKFTKKVKTFVKQTLNYWL